MIRVSCFGGAFLCFASLAIAYVYMEKYLLLPPCPLCILDRIVVAAMGFIFILCALLPNWRRVLWAANALCLAAGFWFAGRHVWLQRRTPDESAGCIADNAAAETLSEIVRRAFDSAGDCGAVYWQFLGLTIPEQVLVLFFAFAAILGAQAKMFFAAKKN